MDSALLFPEVLRLFVLLQEGELSVPEEIILSKEERVEVEALEEEAFSLSPQVLNEVVLSHHCLSVVHLDYLILSN